MENEYGKKPLEVYKLTNDFEEAKRVMQDYSPEKTERLKKANLESIFLYGLAGSGVGALGLSAAGALVPEVVLPLALSSFGLSAIVSACRILKDKKKNDAIMSGKYFEGKSEDKIIKEANKDYVVFANRMEALEQMRAERQAESEKVVNDVKLR